VTSGSDAHQLPIIAQGGIMTEQPIKTTEEYIAVIEGPKAELIKNKEHDLHGM